MKLVRFRVRNYRSIDDSGWIPVDRVTAFVGRNEAGKTSLLKALHKFNPASDHPYEPLQEFPRDRFTRDYKTPDIGGPLPVCSADFEISKPVHDLIATLLPEGTTLPTNVVVTRHYDGSMTYEYTPHIQEISVATDTVIACLKEFSASVRRLPADADNGPVISEETRRSLLNWSSEWSEKLVSIVDLRNSDGSVVLRELLRDTDAKSRPECATPIEVLRDAVAPVLVEAERPRVAGQVDEIIRQHLPVFIYFENYGILDSAISVSRFVEDKSNTPNDPRIRTTMAMFSLADLDPVEIMELGQTEASEQRRRGYPVSAEQLAEEQKATDHRHILLNSASSNITRRFSKWWSQRRHQIHCQVDGDQFRIWVADDLRPEVRIELESRSKGFQWFFSFYLVFLVESEEMHKDAVLLLDEPGLHLHPTAQQELISFFEELSDRNQVLYTTHSPFLIDGQHLDRVRAVSEDSSGHARITTEYWSTDADTIFPLRAAAGYAMIKDLFLNMKHVLVEGWTDFRYITALSHHCSSAGLMSLHEDIYVTPCGGTKNVGYIAALFLGHGRTVILLDGDEAGRARRNSLLKELFKDRAENVVMLDSVLGRAGEEVEIEDIVGPEETQFALKSILFGKLTLEQDGGGRSLTSLVKSSAENQGVELPRDWKWQIAGRLCASWANGREVPRDVLERAARLFGELNSRFEDAEKSDN